MAFNKENFSHKGDLGNSNSPNVATYLNVDDDDLSIDSAYFAELADVISLWTVITVVNPIGFAQMQASTYVVIAVSNGSVTTQLQTGV